MPLENCLSICLFKGCKDLAIINGKCISHRFRMLCTVDGCRNQMYARKLCVRHGGKRKCQVNDCDANARRHGFCCRHGLSSSRQFCKWVNCPRYAHARGFCAKHGGGRICSVPNCTTYARGNGTCQRHESILRSLMGVNAAFRLDCSTDCLDMMEVENWMQTIGHEDVLTDADSMLQGLIGI